MWIVISANNINLFKQEIKKKFLDIEFYCPKIKSKNYKKSKFLLGSYLFCYSEEFNKNKNFIFDLKFIKGLKKFLYLETCKKKKIIDFINFCKSHEDSEGYIKNTFFKKSINYKGTFLNGAFTNQIFNLIEKEKNKIKVFVGDIKISISDKSNFNYSAL
tara:strand:+ start:335 stop:811 length:477 start_codon:yes stop_codon:yes gene_type:complete